MRTFENEALTGGGADLSFGAVWTHFTKELQTFLEVYALNVASQTATPVTRRDIRQAKVALFNIITGVMLATLVLSFYKVVPATISFLACLTLRHCMKISIQQDIWEERLVSNQVAGGALGTMLTAAANTMGIASAHTDDDIVLPGGRVVWAFPFIELLLPPAPAPAAAAPAVAPPPAPAPVAPLIY